MASLTGNKIKDTYSGLIKTDDNAIVGATEKQITDGLGNAIPMTIGTGGVSFTGGADFTGATVTGLPSAGLVSGTGADSMQSAASLTTVAANAAGLCSIALGNNARACGPQGISIGNNSQQLTNDGVVIGPNACSASNGTAIGPNTKTTGNQGLAIGHTACAIGTGTAVGRRACGLGDHSFAGGSQSSASAACAIAIGFLACSATTDAIALGANVTAAKTGTVTVKELETCVAGGGIYLTTPDGLAQPKLTVDNTCALLVDGSPVGGGGAAGLESGTGPDSMQSAASLTTVAADAQGQYSVALGYNAVTTATASTGIAIGINTLAESGAVSIGSNNKACGSTSIAIGANACATSIRGIALSRAWATGNCGVAIGDGACATALSTVAIGTDALALASNSIAIHGCLHGTAVCGIAIGFGSCIPSGAVCGIALGRATRAAFACSTALGVCSCACAIGAVALGSAVTASKAETVTVKELETCVAGGGITLKSADTTEEKMTLTDADVLAVGGDTIPANDSATPTVVNRIWSGSQAQYDALGTYDANTLYYIA